MKYLIGVLIFIFLLIFVIIKLLSGGSAPKNLPPSLISYANSDTVVRYIIDNPTQNDSTHRDIIITVGKDAATLTITGGYNGNVISSNSFTSNPNAYAAFLAGLEKSAAFTKGNTTASAQDERGYCATGNRYSYDIVDGDGKRIQHFWSTTCGTKTFKGEPNVASLLFIDSISGGWSKSLPASRSYKLSITPV
jgi:hypothetical protein